MVPTSLLDTGQWTVGAVSVIWPILHNPIEIADEGMRVRDLSGGPTELGSLSGNLFIRKPCVCVCVSARRKRIARVSSRLTEL